MAKIKTYANDNTINANDKLIGTDFNDSDKTKNYLISELKNYILNGLDTRPYKVYTALLTQTGTDAPVATVLENTLGGTVVWSYEDVGHYRGTPSQAIFDETKTFHFVNSNNQGYQFEVTSQLNTNDDWRLLVVDGSAPADSSLEKLPIEIRVYN
jgi:hypothetical protein